MSMRNDIFADASALCLALCLASSALPSLAADNADLYRCPGNDYSNTISASEADKRHCKKVENAPVSVIRSADAASAPPPPPSASAVMETTSPADSAAMRTRASNARRSLVARLKSEESRLAALETEFNGGEPERRMDEFDFQKYLDRVANMRTEISRTQIDIADLRHQLEKLPAPR